MGEHSVDPPTTPIQPVQAAGSGSTARARGRRRRRRWLTVGIAAVAALALAGTGIAVARTGDTGSDYRTATAGTGSVAQIVRSVGTVDSAAKVAPSFPVAGTVATAPVKIGDHVTAGQTLATLDPKSLNNAVDAANSAVTKAQGALAKDQATQTATSPSSSSSSASTSDTAGATVSSSSFTTSGLRSGASALTVRLISAAAPSGGGDIAPRLAAVTSAQQNVIAQQQKVDTDIGTTDADIEAEQNVCGAILTTRGAGSTAGGTVTQPQTDTQTETQTQTATTTETATATTTVTAPPPDTTPATAAAVVTTTVTAPPPDTTPATAAADATTTMTNAGFSRHAITTSAAIAQAAFRLAGDPQTPTTTGTSTDADALATCQVAIGRVIDDQTQVSQSQADLQKIESALNDAVTALSAADQGAHSGAGSGSNGSAGGAGATTGSCTGAASGSGTSPGSGAAAGSGSGSSSATGSGSGRGTGSTGSTGGSGSGSGTGPSSGSGTGAAASGGGSSSAPVTAEQLSADQAQIDAAQAALALAQANVGQATLTSPLAGTVAAVAITAGQTVSASSTSQTITVIGPGNYQISTTAALSIVDKIKVGQPATVTVDGGDSPLTGTVAVIGALKSSTSSSTNPVYPVLITLDQTDATLFNGAGASVSITVGHVDGVLTVPSSAIKTVGSQSTVQVLTNGVPTTTAVTVGAIGNDLTQILSGITAGQQVVIADLNAALPTATTTAAAGAGRVIAGLGGTGGAGRGTGTGGGSRPGG